jgi:hypothetical protein
MLLVSGFVLFILGNMWFYGLDIVGIFLIIASLVFFPIVNKKLDNKYDEYIKTLPYFDGGLVYMLFVKDDSKEECNFSISSYDDEQRYFRKIYSMLEKGYSLVEVKVIENWVE